MIDILIFIFKYLPSILIHLLLLVSILGFVASFLVPINRIVIKNISIALFVVSIYLEGGLAVTKEYERRESEWKQKIQDAETKSKQTNEKIKYIFINKTKKIKEVQEEVGKKIDSVSVEINKECRITTDTIEILNDAARNEIKKENK